ncbi:MAG: hypothetical protein ACRDT5_15595 [Mycobacterium sp.]
MAGIDNPPIVAPADHSSMVPVPYVAAAKRITPFQAAKADFSRQFEAPKLAKIAQ